MRSLQKTSGFKWAAPRFPFLQYQQVGEHLDFFLQLQQGLHLCGHSRRRLSSTTKIPHTCRSAEAKLVAGRDDISAQERSFQVKRGPAGEVFADSAGNKKCSSVHSLQRSLSKCIWGSKKLNKKFSCSRSWLWVYFCTLLLCFHKLMLCSCVPVYETICLVWKLFGCTWECIVQQSRGNIFLLILCVGIELL